MAFDRNQFWHGRFWDGLVTGEAAQRPQSPIRLAVVGVVLVWPKAGSASRMDATVGYRANECSPRGGLSPAFSC